MDLPPAEDENGVDIAQLEERLKLTPSERVDRLIEEVRVWSEIREASGSSQ